METLGYRVPRLYTVKQAARILGLAPISVRRLAVRMKLGIQPGGWQAPRYFTHEMILKMRNRGRKWVKVEAQEDRKALGLDPMFQQQKEMKVDQK